MNDDMARLSGHVEERLKGLEPSTSTLARLHSTTELRPLMKRDVIYSAGAMSQAGIYSLRRPSTGRRAEARRAGMIVAKVQIAMVIAATVAISMASTRTGRRSIM